MGATWLEARIRVKLLQIGNFFYELAFSSPVVEQHVVSVKTLKVSEAPTCILVCGCIWVKESFLSKLG